MDTPPANEHDNETEETVEEPTHEGSNSLRSRLREKRQNLGKAREPLKLEIPGYDGLLVVEYKMVDWEIAKKIGEKTQKSKNPRRELLAQCSLIVHACKEILMLDEENPDPKEKVKLKPFRELYLPEDDTPELSDEPITWASPELDLILSLEPACQTSRERVLRTFSNDLAVSAHHQELTEWLQSNQSETDEDFTEN